MNLSGPAGEAGTGAGWPPRAMRADARRNRDRIIAAATATFTERGTDEASLEDIARRAGVGIGTLYRHFPTRQALLEAVYRDQVEALRSRADELAQSASPGEALAAFLVDLADFSRTKRRLTATMLATLRKDSELMSSCSAIMRGAVADVLSRAQQAGAARAGADPADVLRLVHAISIAADSAPDDPDQVPRLLGLVLDGLRPEIAGRAAPARADAARA